MKITTIRFNTNLIRTIFSLIYTKLFKNVNLFFLPNLEKKKFEHKFHLKKNDVLIKTLLCGYCGTDKKIITFDMSVFSSAFLDSPKHKSKMIYLGHEIVGQVVAKGRNVKKIKLNDKVIFDSVIRNSKDEKNNVFGGFTNYFVKNENQLEVINKKLPNDKAILIEPLACSLAAIKKTLIKKNDKILIIGGGIIGQGIMHLLRHFYGNKIKIVIATNSKDHLSVMNKSLPNNIIFKKNIFIESKKILKTNYKSILNNKIISNGYDIIFECSGSDEMINKAMRLTSKNSEILLAGMNMNYVKIDPTPIWHRNIKIKASMDYKYKYSEFKKTTLKYIHDLIYENKININNLKIKKIGINEWHKLFNKKNYGSIKKAITFND